MGTRLIIWITEIRLGLTNEMRRSRLSIVGHFCNYFWSQWETRMYNVAFEILRTIWGGGGGTWEEKGVWLQSECINNSALRMHKLYMRKTHACFWFENPKSIRGPCNCQCSFFLIYSFSATPILLVSAVQVHLSISNH